jgi:hypothetical protein
MSSYPASKWDNIRSGISQNAGEEGEMVFEMVTEIRESGPDCHGAGWSTIHGMLHSRSFQIDPDISVKLDRSTEVQS